MSRQREKGTWFETAVSGFLAEALGAVVHRLGMGGVNDRGDIHVDGLDMTIECKNHARMALAEWMDEAERESGNAGTRCGVVVHHRRGRGAARIADSYVTMRLGDFAALLTMILEGDR